VNQRHQDGNAISASIDTPLSSSPHLSQKEIPFFFPAIFLVR
jgi:hypothetical protein